MTTSVRSDVARAILGWCERTKDASCSWSHRQRRQDLMFSNPIISTLLTNDPRMEVGLDMVSGVLR
jgi:hypothetical protein